jgi:hypothetical protein
MPALLVKALLDKIHSKSLHLRPLAIIFQFGLPVKSQYRAYTPYYFSSLGVAMVRWAQLFNADGHDRRHHIQDEMRGCRW